MAHQLAFKSYLKHGVAIKRLNPRLLNKRTLENLIAAGALDEILK